MQDPEDWKRLEDLFHRTCGLPEDEREAYAQAQAGDHPELLAELLKMLGAVSAATDVVREPLHKLSSKLNEPANAEPEPGTRFGPWEVDKLIGTGGMGRVYLGHRADGAYEQQVAIKVIASKDHDLRRRNYFEFERQMLAHMQHPVIAQIIDAGSDELGRLYLVMEYVEGLPLVRWCKQHKLSLRRRVELLIQVAEGVQHAHQKGVVHRDLKPSNILISEVDGRTHPKIIDFGIAAQTDGGTEGQMDVAGTPGYMSPEQATAGLDVDSRSDVYSLGALLYELISGKRPGGAKTLEDGSSNEPLRPSDRINTLTPEEVSRLAEDLHTPPQRLRRLLRDDLDWIVAKATQPDRDQRYSSASALAEDMRRWLDGYPPTAAPYHRLRVIRKFIARNRFAVAAVSALALAIIGGLVATSWAWQQAEKATKREKATSEFLTGVLTSVDPALSFDLDQTLMRRVLDKASDRIKTELPDQPEAQANLEMTLSYTYGNLGDMPRAIEHAESALALAEQHLGSDSLTALVATMELGNLLTNQGEFKRAEVLYRQALPSADKHRRIDEVLEPRMRSRLGWNLYIQSRPDEALPLLQEAYETLLQRVGADHVRTMDAGQYYAIALQSRGHLAEAIVLMEELVKRQARLRGNDHPQTMALRNSLAGFYSEAGDLPSAERESRLLLDALGQQHGTSHQMQPILQLNLATTLHRQNVPEKSNEAGELYELAVAAQLANHGPDTPQSIIMRRVRADWLYDTGRTQEAYDEQLAALESGLKVFGETNVRVPDLLTKLARSELSLGLTESAHEHVSHALVLLQEHHADAQEAIDDARGVLDEIDAAASTP